MGKSAFEGSRRPPVNLDWELTLDRNTWVKWWHHLSNHQFPGINSPQDSEYKDIMEDLCLSWYDMGLEQGLPKFAF